MALHVEIDRHEILRAALIQIARDRQRLQENLRHYHRTAEVEHDAAVVEIGERRREASEIAMARVADRRATGRRVLMDDLGAERRMDACCDAETVRVQQYREI